jgi:hypothetical protein
VAIPVRGHERVGRRGTDRRAFECVAVAGRDQGGHPEADTETDAEADAQTHATADPWTDSQAHRKTQRDE